MTPYTEGNKAARKSKLEAFLFATTFLNINFGLYWLIRCNMSNVSALELASNLSFSMYALLAEIKMFLIWLERSKVNALIKLMKQHYPKTSKDQVAFDVQYNLRNMFRLERLYLTDSVIGSLCSNVLALLWSLIEYFINSRNEFVGRFPYFKRYSFEVGNIWIYSAAYAQQVHMGVTSVICFIAVDVFLIGVMSIILMNLRYVQRQLVVMVLQGNEEDLVKLKAIMNFHQKTLIISKLTSEAFSSSLLLTILTSTMIICLCAFQATAQHVSMVQMVVFMAFLVHELISSAIICYFGQMLMDYVSSRI